MYCSALIANKHQVRVNIIYDYCSRIPACGARAELQPSHVLFVSVNKLFPMFAFHAGHLPTQQAKVVQSWKGVARVIHTATVQSAAEKATLTAENKALKSRRRELEAQTHDLQCIVGLCLQFALSGLEGFGFGG